MKIAILTLSAVLALGLISPSQAHDYNLNSAVPVDENTVVVDERAVPVGETGYLTEYASEDTRYDDKSFVDSSTLTSVDGENDDRVIRRERQLEGSEYFVRKNNATRLDNRGGFVGTQEGVFGITVTNQ